MQKRPFLGVYYNSEGSMIDLYSGEVIDCCVNDDMCPFYGVYYDKDGVEHDIGDTINNVRSWNNIKYNGIIITPQMIGVQEWPINNWLSISLEANGSYVKSQFVSNSSDIKTIQFGRTSAWSGASQEVGNVISSISAGSPVQIDTDEGYGGNTVNVIYLYCWEDNLAYDVRIFTKMNAGNANISIRIISRD